jgi:hypothetical protein
MPTQLLHGEWDTILKARKQELAMDLCQGVAYLRTNKPSAASPNPITSCHQIGEDQDCRPGIRCYDERATPSNAVRICIDDILFFFVGF